MPFEFVLTEVRGPVGIVTINRPQVRNALNHQTIAELVDALDMFDRDDRVRCMILTGDDRAFAAGADISQMVEAGAVDVLDDDNFARWARFKAIHKPVIAAVSGYALGGGCELALMCDLVVASETAQFGQPEVKIGIIPGAGGTQRLPRLIGPARAKDLIYSGRHVSAEEAKQIGLVDQVFPADETYAKAVETARRYARGPLAALRAAKIAVNWGARGDFRAGMVLERELFVDLFSTEDQKEGMRSLLEQGPGKATFSGR